MMAGLALVAFLTANQLGASRQLGWLVAPPLVAASYLVISGIWGICIVHAVKGNRRADYGPEAVLDPASRARMRTRAVFALFVSIIIGCSFAAAFVVHG